MKYLAQALLLCALASLSNAYCFRTSMKQGVTHCQDNVDQTWHAVGSSWRNSNCFDCTCDGCCSAFSTPTFPDYCEKVFDSAACEYRVHRKDDPSVLCPIYGAYVSVLGGVAFLFLLLLWAGMRKQL